MLALESQIETKVVHDAAKYLNIYSIKLNGRGQTGWPDRLFLLPYGKVVFVEFKRPGGKLSEKQKVLHTMLRRTGHEVMVFDDVKKCLKYLEMVK